MSQSYKPIRTLVLILILIIVFYNIEPPPVFAGTDLQVECKNKGSCSIEPKNTALFSEENLQPGENVQQIVTVRNKNTRWACAVLVSAENESNSDDADIRQLPDQHIIFSVNNSTPFTLSNLLSNDEKPVVGYVDPKSTEVFTWEAKLDQSIGNKYQGATTKFDLLITVECDDPAVILPKLPSIPIAIKDPISENDSTAVTVSMCTPPPPPSNLKIQTLDESSARLSWTDNSSVQNILLETNNITKDLHYAITIPSTNSYVIRNLEPDEYTFSIKYISSCGSSAVSELAFLNRSSKDLETNQSSPTPTIEVSQSNLERSPEVLGASIALRNENTEYLKIRWETWLILSSLIIIKNNVARKDFN